MLGVQRRDDWEDVKHADKGVSGYSRQDDSSNDTARDLGHTARADKKRMFVSLLLGRGQRALGKLA